MTSSDGGSCSTLELKAKATGRGYYCAALHGESEYNITINSDLTVSCNCQDYEGIGNIGDLHKNSFEEVLAGPWPSGFATNWRRQNADSDLRSVQ